MIEIRKHEKAGVYEPELFAQIENELLGIYAAKVDDATRQITATAFNEALANCHMWKQPACGPTWGLYVASEDGAVKGCYFLAPPPESPLAACCRVPVLQFLVGDGAVLSALAQHAKERVKAAGYQSWESTHYSHSAESFDSWHRRMTTAAEASRVGAVLTFQASSEAP